MAEIAGLKLIVPTSVAGSGVSVSASGKVTFTAATSISVNGCFSATYDNYLIVMRAVAGSGTVDRNVRLRASGTDATGSNYTRQLLIASSTTITGSRATTTFARMGDVDTTLQNGSHLYLYGPFLSQPTAMRHVGVDAVSSARTSDFAATHSLSTSYDGITIYPDSSNLTGALTIYGLAN